MHRYVAGTPNMHKTWAEYKAGFGSIDSDVFWTGLETLHQVTTSASAQLRVEVKEAGTQLWYSFEYWVLVRVLDVLHPTRGIPLPTLRG